MSACAPTSCSSSLSASSSLSTSSLQLKCGSCEKETKDGQILSGKVFCKSCVSSLSSCSSCFENYYDTKKNICMNCSFQMKKVVCNTCKKEKEDGVLKQGRFLCKGCEYEKESKIPKCPSCCSTSYGRNYEQTWGTVAGGSGGYAWEECNSCGYKSSRHEYND